MTGWYSKRPEEDPTFQLAPFSGFLLRQEWSKLLDTNLHISVVLSQSIYKLEYINIIILIYFGNPDVHPAKVGSTVKHIKIDR